MDIFSERYAEAILRHALGLARGDVLSINTEADNLDFAHDVARKAREITGNGSFIQTIENGKVISSDEVFSDFPISAKPTALLYIPVYREYGEIDAEKLTPAAIQRFRHLSDPLGNPAPSLAFAAAPAPSDAWGAVIEEDGDRMIPASLISSLLSLEEDSFISKLNEDSDLVVYERNELNKLDLCECRIADENGTDISFRFLPGSRFATTITELPSGKRFVPTVFASDIFRAIDPSSADGYITSTRPFMHFGRKVSSFSAAFRDGCITEFSTDEETGELFRTFLSLDQNAGRLSELSFSELSSGASDVDYFALPEWDRMRTVSLSIGGPRPESIGDDAGKANDSLVTLSIPVGTDQTEITATDSNGNEFTIMEDGFIPDEF